MPCAINHPATCLCGTYSDQTRRGHFATLVSILLMSAVVVTGLEVFVELRANFGMVRQLAITGPFY
jgi:hypothetical protein